MTDSDNVIPLTGYSARRMLDDLLSRRSRIRRTRGMPDYYEDELTKTHSLRLPIGHAGYELQYRRGGWRKLGDDDCDEQPVRFRQTHAWIVHRGCKVGAVEIMEIDAELVCPFAVFDALDAASGALAELAEALLSCWPDLPFEVTCYGPVLLLEHVWLEPGRCALDVGLAGVDALVAKLLPRCAIMVTRPFPTEYGGRVPDDAAPSNIGFRRRLNAMTRVAERRLGLQRLPLSAEDDEVFLWRPRPGVRIPAPAYHRDWRKGPLEDSANDA